MFERAASKVLGSTGEQSIGGGANGSVEIEIEVEVEVEPPGVEGVGGSPGVGVDNGGPLEVELSGETGRGASSPLSQACLSCL